jgi:hypothetical protein
MDSCPACIITKEIFQKHNIEFTEKKVFKDFSIPELAPVLGDVGNRLKNEDVSLTDRFADASVVPDLIKNSMSGFMSQQMMNLRQQKFAASQAQAPGGGNSGGGGDSSNINPFTGQPY